MSEQLPDGITAEDWAATPLSVRVLVRALQEQVTRLEQRVRVLEEQGRQTSRTLKRLCASCALLAPQTWRAALPDGSPRVKSGWAGRIRTCNLLIQSECLDHFAPYRSLTRNRIHLHKKGG